MAIGQALQGHIDGDAIVASMMAIVGAFLPAAQLALPEFRQAKIKGEIPVLVGDLFKPCPNGDNDTKDDQ